MNDQVLNVGTDQTFHRAFGGDMNSAEASWNSRISSPTRRAAPGWSPGSKGIRDVALDVLEHAATLIIETKSAWRCLVTHGIEMAQERVD